MISSENRVKVLLNQLNDLVTRMMYATEATETEKVLERIAHEAGKLVGARYSAIGIPTGDGGLRYFKVAGVTPEEISQIEHPPIGRGLLGAVMNERETLRLEHIRSDPRSSGFPNGHPHMDRFLGTPIQVGEQLFGMFYVCDRVDGEPFSAEDAWLLETLAGYAALAIAGTRLVEQQSRLRLLEERERISMELHDGIIQSLYAVGMGVEVIRTDSKPQTEEHQDQLKPVVQQLNEIIDDIRHYIQDLHRQRSDAHSMRDDIQGLVDRLYISAEVNVEIYAPDTPPLIDEKRFESVIQIINEALSNALRHSQAKNLKVSVVQSEQALVVSVRDDGTGFELDGAGMPDRRGLGMQNMRRRAEMLGAKLEITTEPGTGTHLGLIVPINPEVEMAAMENNN